MWEASKNHYLILVNKLGVILQANPTLQTRQALLYLPFYPCAQQAKYCFNDVRVRVWLGLGVKAMFDCVCVAKEHNQTLTLTALKQYLRAGWDR